MMNSRDKTNRNIFSCYLLCNHSHLGLTFGHLCEEKFSEIVKYFLRVEKKKKEATKNKIKNITHLFVVSNLLFGVQVSSTDHMVFDIVDSWLRDLHVEDYI